ncbi:hypothetical protein ABK040_002145 [Willaertia magna]
MSSLPGYNSEYLHQHKFPHRTHTLLSNPTVNTNNTNNNTNKINETTSPNTDNIVQRLANLKVNFNQFKKEDETENGPFVIGVCGGSASGKTTVCREIVKSLSNKRVVVISQDSFYRNLTPEEKQLAKNSDYDFDHPDAFDYAIFEEAIKELKNGNGVDIPVYDFKTHSRTNETERVDGADVIIIEGILIFFNKSVRDLMDMKIFVDTDADVRLARRIRRDTKERGRDLESVLLQYERFVKPSFDDYIMPTKKYADIIIPRGGANIVAIDLLTQHIKLKLISLDRGEEEEE